MSGSSVYLVDLTVFCTLSLCVRSMLIIVPCSWGVCTSFLPLLWHILMNLSQHAGSQPSVGQNNLRGFWLVQLKQEQVQYCYRNCFMLCEKPHHPCLEMLLSPVILWFAFLLQNAVDTNEEIRIDCPVLGKILSWCNSLKIAQILAVIPDGTFSRQ